MSGEDPGGERVETGALPHSPIRDALLPALAVGMLALPFDPDWLDFESARRGILLILAAALLAVTRRGIGRPGLADLAMIGMCVWLVVRSIATINPIEGILQAAHWTALGALMVWGAHRGMAAVSAAAGPATLLVAGFGLAQVGGLGWPAGYALSGSPVSTLGNLNVAAEFVTVGALLTLHRMRRSALDVLTLFAAGAYLVVNGSLGGIVATGIGLALMLPALVAQRAVAAASLPLGALIALFAAPAVASPPEGNLRTAEGTVATASPSTLDVRRALWDGTVAMWEDAPLFGHGAGQFRFEYPRYRTQDEIEATTFGRQFPTTAMTPHNDLLQIGSELGIVGALLWLVVLFSAVRGHWRTPQGWLHLAPLAAFVAHGMVRAPLHNAPAAALAFAWIGALTGPRSAPRAKWPIGLAVLLGLGGIALVAAHTVAARAHDEWRQGGEGKGMDTAIALLPSEPRFRSLRVSMRCGGVDDGGLLRNRGPFEYRRSRRDLEELARLDPHNVNALFTTAQLAFASGRRPAARAALTHALGLDPREPRVVLLSAITLAEAGELDEAIATLYADPHPTLRARLAEHLVGLKSLGTVAKDLESVRRIDVEQKFLKALDAVLDENNPQRAIAPVSRFVTDVGFDDPRAQVLLAAAYLATDRRDEADRLAPAKLELPRSRRALLREPLDRLRALPKWQATEITDGARQ